MLPHRLAGLVIVPSSAPQASFDLIAAAGVPGVVLDRPSPDPRFDYVTTDNRAAMLDAAHALIGLGHRHILYIVSHPGLVTTRDRIAALREAAAGTATAAGHGARGGRAGFRAPARRYRTAWAAIAPPRSSPATR